MKKIITGVAIALTILGFANAREEESGDVRGNQGERRMVMTMPVAVTTGDKSIDAEVQALQKEMQDKMRTIAEEYTLKIKVLVGDKKLMRASGTKEMYEDMKKMMGTSTRSTSTRGMGDMMKNENGRTLIERSEFQENGIKTFFKNIFEKIMNQ